MPTFHTLMITPIPNPNPHTYNIHNECNLPPSLSLFSPHTSLLTTLVTLVSANSLIAASIPPVRSNSSI